MSVSKIKTIFLASVALFLAITLISYPKVALKASVEGLHTWWEIVFPSLLPFFIIAELLIGFGVVKFIGVLLEPFMKPIFRVPGVGGFVWAMAMASGNPAGAKFTVRLRKEGQISKIEAERLVAFTSCANPLFIFGAVSVGFFKNAHLGILLALSHYLANIFVGIMMRFYGNDEVVMEERARFSIREAFDAMHQTRINDKRPIGKLLGDAVTSSVQTLLMIGGFIILFSVINALLAHIDITDFLAKGVQILLHLAFLPQNFSIPFIYGLFEMTIGSKLISEVNHATLLDKAIAVSFLLAFGGFSIQAQVASLLANSDIRFGPFFIARLVQGIFASILTIFLWNPVYESTNEKHYFILPVFHPAIGETTYSCFRFFSEIGPVITICTLIIYIFIYIKREFKPGS
mgnify:CR=1 FL=1